MSAAHASYCAQTKARMALSAMRRAVWEAQPAETRPARLGQPLRLRALRTGAVQPSCDGSTQGRAVLLWHYPRTLRGDLGFDGRVDSGLCDT